MASPGSSRVCDPPPETDHLCRRRSDFFGGHEHILIAHGLNGSSVEIIKKIRSPEMGLLVAESDFMIAAEDSGSWK